MRILIAGPPKTGNVWLKCMLGSIYDLRLLRKPEVPERPDLSHFREWVERGGFRDGTIFHQHYDYSDELSRAVEAVPAHLVTIIRNPYDAFVSTYFAVNQKAADGGIQGEKQVLVGKPIYHPDVLTFLDNGGYGANLVKAEKWLHSGRAVVVRYEGLHRDPVGTLKRAADQIAPLDSERIAHAVEACSAENMRRRGPGMAKHVRTATVGDSETHLTEQHFRIFRERYADLIRDLGYEVV